MTTRTHNIKIGILPGGSKVGSRAVKKELVGIDDAAKRVRQTLVRTFALLGGGALARSGINTLRQYEQQIGTVGALIGRTEKDFKALSAEAERLGRTTRFSATQAAAGLEFLGRAGFDAQEAIASLQGTLTLAQVGQLSVARSADIASNVLSGFRLEVDQTARVVDVLAIASARSNTNVEQLGEGLKLVAPIAAGLGVDIETTTAAIGKLSDAGLQGTLAGTGLRRVLSELENPGSSAAAVFEKLGINAADLKLTVEGNGGLVGALEKLKLAGVDTADALEAFGQRGGPAFQVLVNSIPGVRALNQELKNTPGFAKETADIMDDNLNGAFLRVNSAVEGLIIGFGKLDSDNQFTKAILSLADGINTLTDNLDIAVEVVGEFGAVMAVAFGGRLLFTAAAGLASMVTGATAATIAIGALRGALLFLSGPAGVIALAASAFFVFSERAEDAARGLNLINAAASANVRGLGKLSIDQLDTQIDKRQKAITLLQKERTELKATQAELGKRVTAFAKSTGTSVAGEGDQRRANIFLRNKERLSEIEDFINLQKQESLILDKERLKLTLATVKASGGDGGPVTPVASPERVGATVQGILAELQAEEIAFQAKSIAGRQIALRLLGIQSQLEAELTDEETKQLTLQLMQNEVAARRASLLDELQGPAEDLRNREQDLFALREGGLEVTRQLYELEIARADLAAQNALTFEQGFGAGIEQQVAQARFAFADLGADVAEIFGPSGTLVTGIADSAADALVFGNDFKGALKGIGQSIIRDLIANFIKVQIQQKIIGAIGKAESVATTASGVAQAGTLAAAYAPAAAAASLATSGGNAAGAASGVGAIFALLAGLVATQAFATGGFVSGPGGPTSDSILARLSDGEFVMNANATRRYRPLLEGLNNGGVGVASERTPGGGSISIGDISVQANTAEDAEIIANQIRETVLTTIADERRVGGILESV